MTAYDLSSSSKKMCSVIVRLYFSVPWYHCLFLGSPHDPKFTVTTTLNGRTFFGAGASKQKAKFELAVVVLKTLGFASQLGEPVYEDPPLQSGSLKSPNLWPYSPNSLQNRKKLFYFQFLKYLYYRHVMYNIRCILECLCNSSLGYKSLHTHCNTKNNVFGPQELEL